ncbi:MAG TPA: hypothetical protein VGM39_07475 [Kofleriaceae bacterium]
MGNRLAAVFVVGAVTVLGACKDDPLPYTGGPDIDAAPVVDGPPGLCGTGTLGYLEVCDTNGANQCGSCACTSFGHEAVCTKPCTAATAATDCPAPSLGCSSGGFCRPSM